MPEDLVLEKRKQEIEKMYLSHGAEFTPLLFAISVLLILYAGWKTHLENYITAESGLGYWLGIVGTVMMFSTLFYSLRKRLKSMRNWGAIRTWFTVHMVLGIIGPVIIVFHSNYSLGSSKNEQVAMISMIIVVISGIVGRYLHDKILYGLYKTEATLEHSPIDSLFPKSLASQLQKTEPEFMKKILNYKQNCQIDASGLIQCFFNMLTTHFQIALIKPKAKKILLQSSKELATHNNWTEEQFKENSKTASMALLDYLDKIQKITVLTFYERLLSVWYFLHVPLFYMMMFSVIFHIIAVHMYSAHSI